MDIKMPVMDGFEATRQIIKIRPDAIILSQTAYADEMEKILECGCIGSLSKPFVRQQLLETISDYLTDIKA